VWNYELLILCKFEELGCNNSNCCYFQNQRYSTQFLSHPILLWLALFVLLDTKLPVRTSDCAHGPMWHFIVLSLYNLHAWFCCSACNNSLVSLTIGWFMQDCLHRSSYQCKLDNGMSSYQCYLVDRLLYILPYMCLLVAVEFLYSFFVVCYITVLVWRVHLN